MTTDYEDEDDDDFEKPEIGRNVVIPVKCKDCIGFKHLAIYKKPCDKLGVLGFSAPCKKFTVNPFQLNLQEKETNQLLATVGKLKEESLPRLAAILVAARRMKRHGFKIGEIVYVRTLDRDYISNYVRGRAVSSNGSHILVLGMNGYRAIVFKDSVISAVKWIKHRAVLKAMKKIVDPRLNATISKEDRLNMRSIDYEPPEMAKPEVVSNVKKKIKPSRAKEDVFTIITLRGGKRD